MGDPVSRRCLRRKTAQMLERSQSLLQYNNTIARLQDWFSTDRGSHHKMKADKVYDGSEEGTADPTQKQTVVSVDREH